MDLVLHAISMPRNVDDFYGRMILLKLKSYKWVWQAIYQKMYLTFLQD